MKKIILFVCLFGLIGTSFALDLYTPTTSDKKLLNNVEQIVEIIGQNNPAKLESLEKTLIQKIGNMSAPQNLQQQQVLYIFKSLLDIIFLENMRDSDIYLALQVSLLLEKQDFEEAFDLLYNYPDKSEFREIERSLLYSAAFFVERRDIFDNEFLYVKEKFKDSYIFNFQMGIIDKNFDNISQEMADDYIKDNTNASDFVSYFYVTLNNYMQNDYSSVDKEYSHFGLNVYNEDLFFDIITNIENSDFGVENNFLSYKNISFVYHALGNRKKTTEYIKKSVMSYPTISNYYSYGQSLLTSCQTVEATNILEKIKSMGLSKTVYEKLYNEFEIYLGYCNNPETKADMMDYYSEIEEKWEEIYTKKMLERENLKSIGKVAFWQGMNNQYRFVDGDWSSDPDGHGLGNAGEYGRGAERSSTQEKRVAYCQKFFPKTIATELTENEAIDVWYNANSDVYSSKSHTNVVKTYDCLVK